MKLTITKKPYWIIKFRFEGSPKLFSEKVESLALSVTTPLIESKRKQHGIGSGRVHVGYARSVPYTAEEQEEAKDWIHSRRHTPMKLNLKAATPMKIPKATKVEEPEDDSEVEFIC